VKTWQVLAILAAVWPSAVFAADPEVAAQPASGEAPAVVGSLQNGAQDALDRIRAQMAKAAKKPPEPPQPPPTPLAPPPVLSLPKEVAALPPAQQQMVQAVAARVSEADKRSSAAAEARAIADRAPVSPSIQARPAGPPPAPAAHQLTFGFGDAYEQAVMASAFSGRAAAAPKGMDHDGQAREIAQAAFGNVIRSGGPEAVPAGTQFFNAPRHMHDSSYVHPGSGKGLIIKEVPPPPKPAAKPVERRPPGGEKGVRIVFDANALAAASITDSSLADVRRRLTGARSAEELAAALSAADDDFTRSLLPAGGEQVVSKLTAVSLKRLLAEVEPYRAKGGPLPEALRHPGPLRRIHGYIVRPEEGDLIIFGTAEGAAEPIDIDDLAVGLAAGWRDGRQPGCSLDPNPYQFGGPQQVRVLGVPHDSHFARVMLDADYEMKKATLGVRPTAVAGFADLPSLGKSYAENHPEGPSGNLRMRFWFTPVTPGPGEVRLSPDRDMAVFNAAVQVLVEDMQVSGGTLVGTGRCHPVGEQIGRFTTQHMAELEAEIPDFAQLHSLFDIMLMASLLKQERTEVAALRQFCDLPPRHVDVPQTYQGLTRIYNLAEAIQCVVMGGVELKTELPPGTIVQVVDDRLQRLADQLSRRDLGVARSVDSPLGVPAARQAGPQAKATAALQVSRAASKGHGPQALAMANHLVDENPDMAEAYRARALAYASAGLFRLADRDLWTASQLSSGQGTDRLLRLALLLERGDLTDINDLGPAARQSLVEGVQILAAQHVAAGAFDTAIANLSRALQLMPSERTLREARAGAHAVAGHTQVAIDDLGAAMEGAKPAAALLLARAALRVRLGAWKDVYADASLALDTDPRLIAAYLLRAAARLGMNPLATQGAYDDIKRAAEIDPANAMVHLAKAQVLQGEGDRDGAWAACDKALAANQGFADAYVMRATMRAARIGRSAGDLRHTAVKNWQPMLEDLNMALAVNPTQVMARVLRSEVMTAIASIPPTSENYWASNEKCVPVVVAALADCPEAQAIVERMGALGGPASREQAETAVALLRAALIAAAIGDLEAAAPNVPDPARKAAILAQAAAMRSALDSVMKGTGR
jgi:tetratricopeptide (TPR) repeat protein